MEIKISIIAAVFNDERHIERCILSVINQNYSNYELIIVDDGSTDKTPDIVNGYAKGNGNINLFSVSHKGLGSARNIGLENTTGDYILFLDSDDELFPECLSILNKKFEGNNIDALFFSSKIIFSDGHQFNKNICNYYVRPNELLFEEMSAKKFYNQSIEHLIRFGYGYPVVVWGYAYRKNIAPELRFLQEMHEDEYFTSALLISNLSMKVKCTDRELIKHYIRSGSITTSNVTLTAVIAYIDAINSLLHIVSAIDDVETLRSFYYNLMSILNGCIHKNKLLGDNALAPTKLIEMLIKPLYGKSKIKENSTCLELLNLLVVGISKSYGLNQNLEVQSIIKIINGLLPR